MSPAEILGLPKAALPAELRLAALRELGLNASSSPAAIQREYRRQALNLHPDRVPQTPEVRQRWARLQAAIAILRPPPEQLSPEEEKRWREAADLAEPFAAGIVEEVGDLLSRAADRLRAPKAPLPGAPEPPSPSLLRAVAADAAQAAVASSQRAVMGKLSQFFTRLRNEKP